MQLCEDGHKEVCYEGRDCPACGLKHELAIAEEDIEKLKARIEDVDERILELEEELNTGGE